MDPGFLAFTSGILLTFTTGAAALLLLTPSTERPLRSDIVTYLTLVLAVMSITIELAILVQEATSTEVVIIVSFTGFTVLFPLWMLPELYKTMARILSAPVARTLLAYASFFVTMTGILLGLIALVKAWLL